MVGTGGRGDAGSDSGDSGGRAAGGDASSSLGGRTSGGASGEGGGTGGESQMSGGAGTVGGSTSDGGSASGGSGGSDGHLHDLGAECMTPGDFGCSAANELLAMICDGDQTWALRETCEDGKKCDPKDGTGTGLCRLPIAECEDGEEATFCSEVGVEKCLPGGFDTQLLEECGPGSECQGAECVLVEDECPEGTFRECEGFEVCGGQEDWCGTEYCTFGMFGVYVPPGPRTLRLPEAELLCPSVCSAEAAVGFVVTASSTTANSALRVRLGVGWRMSRIELDDEGVPEACLEESAERCLIVPFELESGSTTTYEAGISLHPLTEPPVIRNVVVDQVPLGTTCDD